MALLEQSPRSATITADTPMHLLVLDPRSFSTLLLDFPSVSRNLLRGMSARLREARGAPITYL